MLDEHTTTLLRDLTASWHSAAPVTERRREHRISCDFPAVFVPLDEEGEPLADSAMDVRVKNVSRHGIGIMHPQAMTHRLALLAFDTAASEPVRLLVRLNWCRFKRINVHESGGQILKILAPGEGAAGSFKADFRQCEPTR
ncbi:MAG TPA: hypothetical protein VKU82_09205 [Planctomycetaceae bacterium]|nr:hypothetical protein [Planctomycetaceae bacterium]